MGEKRHIENERMRLAMERETVDEDRRDFLIQRVQASDARMMKRERDLCSKRKEVHIFAKKLEEEKLQLDERETLLQLRERRAETVDASSQTPVFLILSEDKEPRMSEDKDKTPVFQT